MLLEWFKYYSGQCIGDGNDSSWHVFVSNVKAWHAQCHLCFVVAVVPLPFGLCGQVSIAGDLWSAVGPYQRSCFSSCLSGVPLARRLVTSSRRGASYHTAYWQFRKCRWASNCSSPRRLRFLWYCQEAVAWNASVWGFESSLVWRWPSPSGWCCHVLHSV